MPYKDPKKAAEQKRKWKKNNPEKSRESGAKSWKKWALDNPEKIRSWRLKKLGWTLELWEAVFAAQNGVCAICKKAEPQRRLAADHEHIEPPKPRGLLCSDCNTALGKFGDNPSLLEHAAAYLRKYGAK